MRDGKPASMSDFRTGDVLSATIITSRPPQVMTQQQVNATLAAANAASGGAPPAAAAPAPSSSASRQAQAGLQATGGISGCRAQDTAEDRQFVAVARAREHRVTRDGAHSDDRAPLRPLGSFAVAGTAFARRHVSAVTGSISTERCRSTVRHGPAATVVAITQIVAVLTARRDDVRNGVSVWCFRISGGGEGRCSASSSSEFFRFSRLVRA